MSDRITSALNKRSTQPASLTETISRAMLGRSTFGQALNQIRSQNLQNLTAEMNLDLAPKKYELAEREFDFNQMKFLQDAQSDSQKAFEDRFKFWGDGLDKASQVKLYEYARNHPETVGRGNADAILSEGVNKLGLRVTPKDQAWDKHLKVADEDSPTGFSYMDPRTGKKIPGAPAQSPLVQIGGAPPPQTPTGEKPPGGAEGGEEAYGFEGSWKNFWNKAADTFGIPLPYRSHSEVSTQLELLHNMSTLTLSTEMATRDTNMVRAMLQDLQETVNTMGTGDQRALDKFKALRDWMQDDILKQIHVLENPTSYAAKDVQTVQMNLPKQQKLLNAYNFTIDNWWGPGGTTIDDLQQQYPGVVIQEMN